MAFRDHVLPCGYEVRLYNHGGVDVKNDSGEWITVASNPEDCAELSRLALMAADCDIGDEPKAGG